MAKPPAKPGPKAPSAKPAPLKVDPEKYPNLRVNPALERALRIRQALDRGLSRDEAVALADEAMGRAGNPAAGRPMPVGRPMSGPRPGGKAERPRRKPAAPEPAAGRRR